MLLEIKDVTKSFTSGLGVERVILNKINLTVKAGEKIAIVGPSGSGKTTLLKLIGCLDSPNNGVININDSSVLNLSSNELASVRNNEIGFVFQQHNLLPQFNVLDNVLIPVLAQSKKVSKQNIANAQNLVSQLGLSHVQNQKPAQLSGGECQRTAVARALINSPSLLLADEPTGALDNETSEKLTQLILELNELKNMALIVATHSTRLASKMDRVFELINGSLIEQ